MKKRNKELMMTDVSLQVHKVHFNFNLNSINPLKVNSSVNSSINLLIDLIDIIVIQLKLIN